MWKKLIGIMLLLVVVSFYYYPFDPFFLPIGFNTKKTMAAFGLLVCGYMLLKKRDTTVPRNIIPLFILAAVVSLVSLFSMAWNRTIDDAYSGYISSMAVWFCAAFVVCVAIRFVHGRIDVKLLCDYLIIVSVIQCFLALYIDNSPAFQHFVDTRIVRGCDMMHELKRLYGIGCGLDTAGIHFSLCLIMIAYLLRTYKKSLSYWAIAYYAFSFAVLTVVGSMIARTTYVGVILAVVYIAFTANFEGATIRYESLKVYGILATIVIVGTIVCVFEYNVNPSFRHWIRFAFEGFFNLFEQGEWSIASNDTLKSMYVWPEKFKTWVIGDGYFSNPYWSDPNYIWQGQNTRGFYMGTDVGYLRFIFYFGLIGLAVFTIFLIKCCKTAIEVLPEHSILFIFCLICGFAVWLKVATDVFFIFALFICVGNMQEASPEQGVEPEGGAEIDDGENR